MCEINCLADLRKIEKNFEWNTLKPYYRGQSDSSWSLVPSLSRLETADFVQTENELIESFRSEISTHGFNLFQSHPTDNYEFGEKWNFLFQSQHLGLPTRLLDWSLSPEAALYFAVNEYPACPGKIFILEFERRVHFHSEAIRAERLFDYDPSYYNEMILLNQSFKINGNGEFFLGEKRRMNQFGRFLFQPISQIKTPFEETCISNSSYNLIEYTIPASAKACILNELNELNYNEETLALTPCKEIDSIIERIKEKYK